MVLILDPSTLGFFLERFNGPNRIFSATLNQAECVAAFGSPGNPDETHHERTIVKD